MTHNVTQSTVAILNVTHNATHVTTVVHVEGSEHDPNTSDLAVVDTVPSPDQTLPVDTSHDIPFNVTNNSSVPKIRGPNDDFGVVVVVCVVCVIVSLAVCVKFTRKNTRRTKSVAEPTASVTPSAPPAPQSPSRGLPLPVEP